MYPCLECNQLDHGQKKFHFGAASPIELSVSLAFTGSRAYVIRRTTYRCTTAKDRSFDQPDRELAG